MRYVAFQKTVKYFFIVVFHYIICETPPIENYKLDNTDIYISNGIGVNNINFRFNNHPTFNLYRLKKSDI